MSKSHTHHKHTSKKEGKSVESDDKNNNPSTEPSSTSITVPVKPLEDDPELMNLYSEIEQGVKQDLGMTSAQQIARLNRPGSTYFNLNPYDVLQCRFTATMPELRKRFKMLSLLLHPDKNLTNKDEARKAFEIVERAYKTILNDEGYRRCKEIVEEAIRQVDEMIAEKRRRASRGNAFKRCLIEEDNPIVYQTTVHKQMCKIFADLERLRQEKEVKKIVEKKKEIIRDAKAVEMLKKENEWKIRYEFGRSSRIKSWHDWQKNSSKNKNKMKRMLKPPTERMEERK